MSIPPDPGRAGQPHTSEIIYRQSLPDRAELGPACLLICDQVLLGSADPAVRNWIASFAAAYAVAAGEGLKDVAALAEHARRLIELSAPLATSQLRVVAVGGGSVGDFAGFFASIFKRGVPLIHIPSTWLAALDSAHGGKNALNVGLVKNQLGTYHWPAQVYLVRSLLATQPPERARECFGELAKIALTDDLPWTKELTDSALQGGELLWKFLPDAVAAKYRIVDADPFERLGLRHRLNLGHTVGHVLETLHQLPHGVAVAQGLRFALGWSAARGQLSAVEHDQICGWLDRRFALRDLLPTLPRLAQDRFAQVLIQDKKRTTDSSLQFVFVSGRGRVATQPVRVQDVISEAIRQGYVHAE